MLITPLALAGVVQNLSLRSVAYLYRRAVREEALWRGGLASGPCSRGSAEPAPRRYASGASFSSQRT